LSYICRNIEKEKPRYLTIDAFDLIESKLAANSSMWLE
jgi:hypothetical protein